VAERFVRTVRSECLDWLLIPNEQHLEQVLARFVAHYDSRRPHRALGLEPPRPTDSLPLSEAERREIPPVSCGRPARAQKQGPSRL